MALPLVAILLKLILMKAFDWIQIMGQVLVLGAVGVSISLSIFQSENNTHGTVIMFFTVSGVCHALQVFTESSLFDLDPNLPTVKLSGFIAGWKTVFALMTFPVMKVV